MGAEIGGVQSAEEIGPDKDGAPAVVVIGGVLVTGSERMALGIGWI